MDTLRILQQNVAYWKPYKHNLINTYRDMNPDIILVNSHGLNANESLNIYGYIINKLNKSNELHDGSAILVKANIKHILTDYFIIDTLQVTVETSTGPINIATVYLPPRRSYLPIPDFH